VNIRISYYRNVLRVAKLIVKLPTGRLSAYRHTLATLTLLRFIGVLLKLKGKMTVGWRGNLFKKETDLRQFSEYLCQFFETWN